jgi:hypothetical protein
MTKRAPLPPDLEQFEEVVAVAGPVQAPTSLAEIERRIAQAKQKLEKLRAAMRRNK